MSGAGSRYVTITSFVLILALMSFSAVQSLAQFDPSDDGAQVELRARTNVVINGVEAELRGDFRRAAAPIRLNAELQNINLPLGVPIAFCLVKNGVTTELGTANVRLIAGIKTAELELTASDGDHVPQVVAGNLLQARQTRKAPFDRPATCSSPLLASAPFQQ